MRAFPFLAVLLLAGTAAAQHVTVTGGPSPIPTSGTGGGTTYPTLPAFPGTADVSVPSDVSSITSIEVANLTHTWIGDLQMVLVDPTGKGHLIFLRPGYLNTSTVGNSGNFAGTYTFVESGGMSLPTTSTTSTNPAPGTYNQSFTSGGVTWVDGDQNIFNTPMTTISGPAGTWTLRCYDWAAGDVGGWASFTLNYRTTSSPITTVCFGDGSGAPCGCGNESLPGSGEGCLNGTGVGATLAATGTPSVSAPNLTFQSGGQPVTQPGLLFQGVNTIGGGTGQTFGDGIRCCGGTVIRMTIRIGNSTTIVNTTAGLGVTPGDKRCYQKWYRDPAGTPCGSTFNLSNAVSITWGP